MIVLVKEVIQLCGVEGVGTEMTVLCYEKKDILLPLWNTFVIICTAWFHI